MKVARKRSESRKIEAALRESEERYRALFEQAADAIVVMDPRTLSLLEFNDEACRRLGYTRAEFTKVKLPDFEAVQSAGEIKRRIRQLVRSGMAVFETRHRTRTGKMLDIEVRIKPIRVGGRIFVQGIWRDITERKQAEEALRESRERLQLALSAAKMGTFDWDIESGKVEWAPETEQMWGLRKGAFRQTYEHWRSLVHPEDLPRAEALARRAVADLKTLYAFEHRIIRPDGTVRWIFSKAITIRDTSGRAIRMVGLNMDITERKQVEAALCESEERYRLMSEAVPHLAWRCDPAGLTIDCNRRWYAYTGQTPAQARGTGWMRAVHPDDRRRVMQRIKDDVSGGEIYQTEYRLRRASDGCYRWHLARALPIRDESQQIVGWLGSAADIEQQKRAEEVLLRAKESLEQKVRERTADLDQRTRQLARLAAELTRAEQKERRRIAHILHEDLQQRLVGILYKIQSAGTNGEKRVLAQRSLDEVTKDMREAIEGTRSLTKSLSPPVLYEFGLRAALEWLAGEMKTQFGLSVRLAGLQSFNLPSDEIQAFAFDAVRELLLNVRKHAGVNAAEIRIREAGKGRIAIEVRDKGTGCAAIRSNGRNFGLFSIRERADAFGAEFSLVSSRVRGTCATLTLEEADRKR